MMKEKRKYKFRTIDFILLLLIIFFCVVFIGSLNPPNKEDINKESNSKDIILLEPGEILWQKHSNCKSLRCLERTDKQEVYDCIAFGDRYCNIQNNCKYNISFKIC